MEYIILCCSPIQIIELVVGLLDCHWVITITI
jgi:hypothetical protein